MLKWLNLIRFLTKSYLIIGYLKGYKQKFNEDVSKQKRQLKKKVEKVYDWNL